MSEVSYHGWTHRPKALGGTDPIPGLESGGIDWAVANGDLSAIVANNTVKNIPFESVDIPPSSTCFVVGTNLKPIYIVKPGWYMIYLEAWPDQAVGDMGVGISYSGSGLFYNFSYVAGGLVARRINYHKNGTLQWGFQETFGPVYAQCSSSEQVRVGGFTYHALDTPASTEWNFGQLVVVYMGPGLDLPDDPDWNPAGEDGDQQFRTYF